jgi:hypothetical protein
VEDDADQATVKDRRPVEPPTGATRPAGSDGVESDLFSQVAKLLDGRRR